MLNRSREECSSRLESLVLHFLGALQRKELMRLKIPNWTHADLQDIMENDDIPAAFSALSSSTTTAPAAMRGSAAASSASGVTVKRLDGPDSHRGYAQIFAVAALIAELAASGRTMSQRDVYYSLKPMFRCQAESNKTVTDIGLLLGLRRFEMGIVPASRGLVAGRLKFNFQTRNLHGTELVRACDSDPESLTDSEPQLSYGYSQFSDSTTRTSRTQINLASLRAYGHSDCSTSVVAVASEWADPSCMVYMESDAQCIVVVEKEGIFKRLVEDKFCDSAGVILVTGCGFPDIATRALVARIANEFPLLPVIGLCDYNPFGAALLMTYKVGSKTMALEGFGHQTSRLKWMGLHASHLQALSQLGVDSTCSDITSSFTSYGPNMHGEGFSCPVFGMGCLGGKEGDLSLNLSLSGGSHGIIEELSAIDTRKLAILIERTRGNDDLCDFHEELLVMAEVGKKCDLESLYALGIGAVSSFVAGLVSKEVSRDGET